MTHTRPGVISESKRFATLPDDIPEYFQTLFPLFVFSGEVGDWKNWFTVAQNEKIDRIMAEKMENISHKFQYVFDTSADDKDI